MIFFFHYTYPLLLFHHYNNLLYLLPVFFHSFRTYLFLASSTTDYLLSIIPVPHPLNLFFNMILPLFLGNPLLLQQLLLLLLIHYILIPFARDSILANIFNSFLNFLSVLLLLLLLYLPPLIRVLTLSI